MGAEVPGGEQCPVGWAGAGPRRAVPFPCGRGSPFGQRPRGYPAPPPPPASVSRSRGHSPRAVCLSFSVAAKRSSSGAEDAEAERGGTPSFPAARGLRRQRGEGQTPCTGRGAAPSRRGDAGRPWRGRARTECPPTYNEPHAAWRPPLKGGPGAPAPGPHRRGHTPARTPGCSG